MALLAMTDEPVVQIMSAKQMFWFTLIISFVTDFVIAAGSCLTAAMVAGGSTNVPSTAVLIYSLISGLVIGARRVQALLSTPPIEK